MPSERVTPNAMGRSRHPTWRAAALAMALGSACTPSNLREWRPEDHDSGATSTGAVAEAPVNDDPLAAARGVFAAQCASCHGASGHGDGPMAAMFHPADLTTPTWQASRTDDEIAASIRNGRGAMPAFGTQLRSEAIPLLVQLIRSWRR